jgi:hypothetical protein
LRHLFNAENGFIPGKANYGSGKILSHFIAYLTFPKRVFHYYGKLVDGAQGFGHIRFPFVLPFLTGSGKE